MVRYLSVIFNYNHGQFEYLSFKLHFRCLLWNPFQKITNKSINQFQVDNSVGKILFGNYRWGCELYLILNWKRTETCLLYLTIKQTKLDCHLNWKKHILNVSKKISRTIGIMYKLREFMNTKMLINIYYSLIYSHMVYAIQVWDSASDTEFNKILVFQKKAVQMIRDND